jgi:DNA-binding transcriptional MocR family regulator
MTAQTGQYVGNQTPEGVINFGLGQPAPTMLPRDRVAEAATRLAQADPLLLQYGAGRGFVDFREALAEFLSRRYARPVGENDVGASGAISLTLSLAADVFARGSSGRRAVVVTEDPTYFLARGIFESSGAEVVGVPTDTQGIDVDALERRLDAGAPVDVVYVIPAFQNPTGATLSPQRRDRLLELADEHDFYVLADEPYNLLGFGTEAPLPLAMFDGGRDRVLSISSFTKILAPGLRLGWVHGSRAVLKRFYRHGVFRSGGALNPVISYVVEGLMRDGSLDAHLDTTRTELKRRADALVGALERRLPQAEWVVPEGGYFAWVRLPGVDVEALGRVAGELGVGFVTGTRCSVAGEGEHLSDAFERLRLSFSFYAEPEIVEGVERLAQAVERLQPASGG